MKSTELRKEFLKFFSQKDHKILPSASLVPPTEVELAGTTRVLFTTAGMHPLVPYLLGKLHPGGKRLVNIQKCLRTDDIDEVGDAWHNTFFEMLGNWSLGDYWKKEAISWSFEFLTKILKIPKEKIWVTVFGGDSQISEIGADFESISIWKSLGISEDRIIKLGKKDNWWGPVGETGPCGPDTEMFVDITSLTHGPDCRPGDGCGRFAEVWNDVFMEFTKTVDGKYEPLKQKNVDTGMGVERTLAVLQGKDNVYDTEVFLPIVEEVVKLAKIRQTRSMRIVADHIRAAVFLLADGVTPANVERGYVLRRLIRRAIRYGKQVGINRGFTHQIAEVVTNIFEDVYPELAENRDKILEQLIEEEKHFEKVLKEGLKKSEKVFAIKVPIDPGKYAKIMQTVGKKEIFRLIFHQIKQHQKLQTLEQFGVSITGGEIVKATITGKEAFDLYQTFGFPIEMIVELAQARRLFVDIESLKTEMDRHRERSRKASTGRFAGGLVEHTKKAIAGHTATHLLHQALRDVLGSNVVQTGSNITSERIRFDFKHDAKMKNEEIAKVEEIVNDKIKANLPVKKEIMETKKAYEIGAIGLFGEKYGDKVSVYLIGDYSAANKTKGRAYSKEFCGGPHAKNTQELGRFKITKEVAVGGGKRRIYAKLEN